MRKLFLILACAVIAVTAVLGGVFIYCGVQNNIIHTTEVVFEHEKIPDAFKGYKIVQLSDFHNSKYPEKVAEAVKAAEPDIIVSTGDMITMFEGDYSNTRKLFEELVKIAPVYMVSGNHEIYDPEWKEYIEEDLVNIGVISADIQSFNIYKNDEYIHIYGLQDPAVPDGEIADTEWLKSWINKAGEAKDENTLNILLSHRANYFDYTYSQGYELTLSGHMHGGVLRLPFVGGVFSPDSGNYFPEYTEGMYEKNGSFMYVSRGLDFDPKRFRMFNPPEIVVITLDN